MRLAECLADLHLTLLGNLDSVSITKGWTGDLDQVIGQTIEGDVKKPCTIADHLGHHLTEENFHLSDAKPAGRRRGHSDLQE
jgi:hypothetical protein